MSDSAGGLPAPPPRACHFLLAACAFSLFVVYGSLVPLEFQPLDWGEAWRRFSTVPWLKIGIEHRADWVANCLLFAPFGFLWLGALTVDRQGAVRKAMLALAVVAAGTTLSLAVEFTQLYFPRRTVSQNDIAAESLGALAGALVWLTAGQALTHWVRRYRRAERAADRVDWLLGAYVVGLLAYSAMPLDLTIGLGELYEKYKQGRISPVPFREPFSRKLLFEFFVDGLTFVPVGLWVARQAAAWRAGKDPLALSICGGLLFAALVEVAQVPVYTRAASATDVVSGGLGALAGIAVARRWSRSVRQAASGPPAAPAGAGAAWRWLLGSMAISAVATCVFLAPFETTDDAALLKKRWKKFWAPPLRSMYMSSEFTAGSSLLNKALWFAPAGAMAAYGLRRSEFRGAGPWRVDLAIALYCGAIGAGIEVAQIFMPLHSAEWSECVWYALGGALGSRAVQSVLQNRRA